MIANTRNPTLPRQVSLQVPLVFRPKVNDKRDANDSKFTGRSPLSPESNCRLKSANGMFQVTSLLLEAERRKLAVLQRELQVALAEGGSVKVKEKQRQELLQAIS